MRNVFWTSGWDSTFRVLELLINDKETVQPFYLLDRDRPSTQTELRQMQVIRDLLAKEFPEALNRLKPLKSFNAHEVEEDQEITRANMKIRAEKDLGTQFHWIARFVKQQQIGRFEMSIDRDGNTRKILQDYLERDGDTFHVASKHSALDEYTLFQWFDFPVGVMERTKPETKDKARTSGFLHILEHSWFCHYPVNNESCGACRPCRSTIEDGMGYRLSWQARYIRYPKRLAIVWLKRHLSSGSLARLQHLRQKVGI